MSMRELLILVCAWPMAAVLDVRASDETISIDVPMTPPSWAWLERELPRVRNHLSIRF